MPIARSFLQTLVAQLLASGLAVLSGILTTRLLGPSGKGVYALLQADVNLMVLLFGFSLPAAIVHFVATRRIALGQLVTIAVGVNGVGLMLTAGSLGALGWTGQLGWFLPGDRTTVWYQAYVALGFLAVSVAATISAVFQGRQQFHWVNAISLFSSALGFVVYGGLFVVGLRGELTHDTTDVVLLAALSLYVLTAFVWIGSYVKHISVEPTSLVGLEPRQLWEYLALTHVGSLVQFLNYQLDTWLVVNFCSQVELGYYSTAVGTGQLLWLISQPMAAVLFPYVSSGSESESRAAFELGSRVCFSLTLALALLAAVLAGVMIPLVYGSAFSPSVESLRLLLPGILVASMTKVLAAYIAGRGLIRYNLVGALIGLGITVMLDLLLIPEFGGRGAAVATTMSYFATWLYCLWTVSYVLRVPIRHAFLVTRSDVHAILGRLRAFAAGRSSAAGS
jgi:O-antigen/teichoic acid export membrane protein